VTRRRVVVRGRVQGVGFRYTTHREAVRAGVSGWVSNRDDGSVEAVFEGDEEAVERLVRWVEDGPPGASVDRVEAEEGPVEGLSGLEVR
jgi:acylphosphatase